MYFREYHPYTKWSVPDVWWSNRHPAQKVLPVWMRDICRWREQIGWNLLELKKQRKRAYNSSDFLKGIEDEKARRYREFCDVNRRWRELQWKRAWRKVAVNFDNLEEVVHVSQRSPKMIIGYNLKGEYLVFDSSNDVAEQGYIEERLRGKFSGRVGKKMTYKGYRWEYRYRYIFPNCKDRDVSL